MILKRIFKIQKGGLFKDAFLYAIAEGINKAMNFLLLPFLTFYLVPSEMGVITNFNVFVQVLSVIGGNAFINIIPTVFYKKGVKIKQYVGGLFLILTGLLFLIAIFVILFNGKIESMLELDIYFQLLVIFTVYSSFWNNIYYYILRLENRVIKFGVLQVTQTLINISTALILVIFLGLGAQGRIYGIVLSAVIMMLYNGFILVREGYISLKITKKIFKTIFWFGLPLIPHSLAFWFKNGVDRIFITQSIGLDANGIYSIAISFGGIFLIASTAFSNSFTPYIHKKLNEIREISNLKNVVELDIVRNTYKFAGLFVLVNFAGIFISNFLINTIIDVKYIEATNYVSLIFISLLFHSFYLLVVNFVYYMKKTAVLGFITLSVSSLQIALSYFLINEIGVMGACYSLLIGNVLIFIGVFVYAQSLYPLPWLKIKYIYGKRNK
jgi:O-antigen/teichoic acid export membrane protein